MIANFTSGSDSDALVRYLLGYGKGEKSDKQAVILGSAGVRTDTLAHLVADFELGRKLHPELEKSVLHISLSFNPDDAARMTNQKMRQVADDYMEQMDLKGTQYLVVRHQDRPHQHLHIMANRVSDDGHTIQDGNNFFASKKALAMVVAKHDLTPAKGNRLHLQHPERLRGKDLDKHEMRQMLRPALLTETQRPTLLAIMQAQGLNSQFFLDQNGKPIGISFRKGEFACKGSALGPEFSLAAIDRQLAANQQKALAATAGQTQSSILPASAPTVAIAPAAQSLFAQVVAERAAHAEQAADPGAEVRGLGSMIPARTNEIPPVEATTEVSPASIRRETQASLGSAIQVEQAFELKLAAWEQQEEDYAYWDKVEENYYNLLAETTQKIATADQASYQSLPAFVVLMQTQGLALLLAEGEEPVRVVHLASGLEFPAEDILLAERPFLDTVQLKVARAAEAAVAQSSPAVVDWETRYQQYVQQREAALTHNKAIRQVNYMLEDHPNATGVTAAMAVVQSPDTPPLANGHLLLSLEVELKRQQERETEICWVAKERARLQEAAKGGLGFFTKAATEARDQLRYLEAPPTLPIQVGALRYLQPEPPALSREQYIKQQQPGLEQVRANVTAALAVGFTQWHGFKSEVDSKEVEAILLNGKEVTFRHKGSGQTYRPDEIVPNFKHQYDAVKARGQAQEARQPQRSTPAKSKDEGYSR